MNCSPPGSFIHGISQARILEQVAISFSSGLPKRMPLSSHTLQADSLPLARPGKPLFSHLCCSLSRVQLFVTPWIAARQSSLSITSPSPYSNSCPLSQWCHAIISSSIVPFSSCLQAFPASGSFLTSWLFVSVAKVLVSVSSVGISSSNKYSGLISFRIDWLDLLAVQGIFKTLLQHHSPKASILQHSPFFRVQLSYPFTTAGKPTALTIWTFVGKVMSLLFNSLCRFVITFLPRSKRLLISWQHSPLQWFWSPGI